MACLIVRQCQEKPTDESLASLLAHAAVVVQVLLQVGEHALHLVVRVGHPLAALLLVGEQVGQVEGDAVHGRPQAAMGVARPARALVELLPFPCAVALGYRRPARRAFFLFIWLDFEGLNRRQR